MGILPSAKAWEEPELEESGRGLLVTLSPFFGQHISYFLCPQTGVYPSLLPFLGLWAQTGPHSPLSSASHVQTAVGGMSQPLITWANPSWETTPTSYWFCFSREPWLIHSSGPPLTSSDLPGLFFPLPQSKSTVSTDSHSLLQIWGEGCFVTPENSIASYKNLWFLYVLVLRSPMDPVIKAMVHLHLHRPLFLTSSLNDVVAVQNSVLFSLFCYFLPSRAMIP